MENVNLQVWNQRMLILMNYQISEDGNGIDSMQDFCKVIGISRSNNINPIKQGKTSFTHDQIYRACKTFGTSVDWVYGFTNEMYRSSKKVTPIQLLRAAVKAVEIGE